MAFYKFRFDYIKQIFFFNEMSSKSIEALQKFFFSFISCIPNVLVQHSQYTFYIIGFVSSVCSVPKKKK